VVVIEKCPQCGFESPEARCPRCNTLKLRGCDGVCSACAVACGVGKGKAKAPAAEKDEKEAEELA
jgi:hypothetical protein